MIVMIVIKTRERERERERGRQKRSMVKRNFDHYRLDYSTVFLNFFKFKLK